MVAGVIKSSFLERAGFHGEAGQKGRKAMDDMFSGGSGSAILQTPEQVGARRRQPVGAAGSCGGLAWWRGGASWWRHWMLRSGSGARRASGGWSGAQLADGCAADAQPAPRWAAPLCCCRWLTACGMRWSTAARRWRSALLSRRPSALTSSRASTCLASALPRLSAMRPPAALTNSRAPTCMASALALR